MKRVFNQKVYVLIYSEQRETDDVVIALSAQSVKCWTNDRMVAGSNPGLEGTIHP